MLAEYEMDCCCLNIVAHPHPDGVYLNLINSAYDANKPIKVWGHDYALLGSVLPFDGDTENIVCGTIYRFTQIDFDAPWLNVSKKQEASEDELRQIQIPEGLRPNAKPFPYILFLKEHKLFYACQHDANHFSPNLGQKFFTTLFNQKNLLIRKKLDEVLVHIEQDRETLALALNLKEIRYLLLNIRRPNPDDFEDAEREVLKELGDQCVSRLREEYKSIPKLSIKPSVKTRLKARIAASNGYVESIGVDSNGIKRKIKTIEHPQIEKIIFDERTTAQTALYRASRNMSTKMKQKRADDIERDKK